MHTVKVQSIGNALGITLTAGILSKLRAGIGDLLYTIETPHGIELTARDPKIAMQMDLAEKIMCEDCDVLKSLAQ